MSSLANKRVLLGVSGGIAAYKAAELVRLLRAAGAEVQVVMTRGATRFITPLTLQALSGRPVREALFDEAAEAGGMDHISLARWADVLLVAPATADLLARLAQGRADDLLTTLCLASRAPLLLAPAMNVAMWDHPATRANVALLESRGVALLGPAEGELACGEAGAGRMLEPAELLAALEGRFRRGSLDGCRVLVTAGPTREPLDPVRYLGNRSSGRMGYAVAEAAALAGARVTLVSGPVALACPPGVERVVVETAAEMHAAVMARAGDCDIFIAAAAVADYRPQAAAAQKIKKSAPRLTLDLVRNPDILADVARLPRPPFTVGFAAETDDLERHARAKRMAKGVDMIAANRVGPGLGFDTEDNELLLIREGGSERLPRAPKTRLARQLIESIAAAWRARREPAATGDDHAQGTA
ncbi:bifunctional phosphopantothenoylcysteine decarboxylase/phosphopantothenate--cysteine ligase CoaBC [Thiohalobacter sp. IOR34]|uniref:bifunctional phosphopantothenoylcysteine decarboxylase/phosphopantothenate--cysteine ligase CoaBC n=1 Tax=Thiohalobacter sp. IOR34 TaxID=3057176 RepID=UPI0025AF156E|nr:bifunctional phosphopantothenoylcysteine decarboxylase/phosphopantothenate--cysteine ligase CoaBC [Thiohalobacter sp. IOR34]WJW75765.1 bifunctional phosphopantothenoylcysteine decarboxylase/phosphopantothenate--cysteine ligase CoaBC [Thiohalobacter sp. IOR34]